MANLSGWRGFVKLGSTTYAFSQWKMSMKGGSPKVTNWTSGGYQALVPGIIAATISVSGPWDVTGMPIAVNVAYVFHLGLDTGVELAVTALVTGIDPQNDVEGTPTVSITAESTGAFTASIA